MEKEISKPTTKNRLCPLVQNPYDDCYFIKMKSQDIAMAMFYCYRNFEICGIYRNGGSLNQTLKMLKKIGKKLIIGLIVFLLFTAVLVSNVFAGATASIYGQSIDFQDLRDQRTFSEGGLLGHWPDFSISWDILYDSATMLWNYEYTLEGDKDISYFILELTNPSSADEIINPQYKIEDTEDGTSATIEGPKFWGGRGYPGLPDGLLYGIKFDVGGETISYSFQTTKDPVWGNFYARDGTHEGHRVYASNNALRITDFDSDNKLDFIPRPDGGSNPPIIPEPISYILFLSGGATLAVRGYLKRRTK